MSKLAQYISRVSKEDAELEQEQLPATEVEQNEIIAEQELEVPEVQEPVSEEEMEAAEEAAEEADAELVEVAEAVQEGAEIETQVQEEVSSIEEFTQILSHGVPELSHAGFRTPPRAGKTSDRAVEKLKPVVQQRWILIALPLGA